MTRKFENAALSETRQSLAKHKAKLAALNADARAMQAKVADAESARSDVINAEEALRTHLFEAEIAGTVDHGRRKQLRDAVVAARARIRDVAEWTSEYHDLTAASRAVAASVRASVRDVVAEEAAVLANRYHHHERLALHYRHAATEMQQAMRDASDAAPVEHGDAGLFGSLAYKIGKSLEYGPDAASALAAKEAIIRSADAYGADWRSFPADVAADPSFIISDPEL